MIHVAIPDLFAGMNGTEKSRAIELEAMKRNGVIAEWRYEKVTLKLADDTRYTPDFWIVYADGSVVFEETKGFMRDDAHVKLKVAVAQFPEFRFRLLLSRPKKLGGGWAITDYSAASTPESRPEPTHQQEK